MFQVPNNRAGIMATITKNMVRLKSMPSRTCTPFLVVWPGVNRKVSRASKTTQKRLSLPSPVKLGLTRSSMSL